MTEEEKEEKIIQDLKIEIERLKKIATYPTGTYVTFEGLTLLLNIIEKKDIEITKLKKHNKDLLRKLRNRVKEVKKLTKYSLYKREFTTLNKQLQQKDKMIDLMVEDISCFNNLSICGDCEKIWEDDYDYTDCNKCIKQYFEWKVIPE